DKSFGLFWECTGGSVTAGEDSITGALRELSEEVGITTTADDLTLINSICLKDRFVDTYITVQNVQLEDLKLQKEEVVNAKFVTYEELMTMWDNKLVIPKERFMNYRNEIKKVIDKLSSNHQHYD
ncbi:MAG TPA: NUDIX domain-containing protein, partial [Mobilitalea sp.]|nr:NUDIX domain-containing protein [Mobilitalea sp.]